MNTSAMQDEILPLLQNQNQTKNRNTFPLLIQSACSGAESEIPSLIENSSNNNQNLQKFGAEYLSVTAYKFLKGMGPIGYSFMLKVTSSIYYSDGHAWNIKKITFQKKP